MDLGIRCSMGPKRHERPRRDALISILARQLMLCKFFIGTKNVLSSNGGIFGPCGGLST